MNLSTSLQPHTVQRNPPSMDSPPPTSNSPRRTTSCSSSWQTQACINSRCSNKCNNSHSKHQTHLRRCNSRTPDKGARARKTTRQDGTQRGPTVAPNNHSSSRGRGRTTQSLPMDKPSAQNSSRVGTATTTTTAGCTVESDPTITTARHA